MDYSARIGTPGPKWDEKAFEVAFLGLTLLFLLSILYSTYLLSISLFGMLLLACIVIERNPLRLRWSPRILNAPRDLLQRPAWWSISLLFFLVLYGAFYSDDTSWWLSRLRIKVPFILAPLAFFAMPAISRRVYLKIHLLLIMVMMVSSIPILFNIVANFDVLLSRLTQGQAIPTPGNHIRYSLLIALACAAGFILSRLPQASLPVRRDWVRAATWYLLVFLHLLAVRSGIAVLYLTAVVWALRNLWMRRDVILSRNLLIAVVILPLIAYWSIPSFSNRIQYMMEDWRQYEKQEWNAYSDAERLLSIRAGMAIARAHPWFGVGAGDLKEETGEYFLRHFDKDTFILPHNQFVSILAGSGAIGLLIFLVGLMLPILWRKHYQSDLFLAFYTVVFFSLMVENTFETSRGVAFFIFFLCSGLNYLDQNGDLSQGITRGISPKHKSHQ